jgi:hypothetical protein
MLNLENKDYDLNTLFSFEVLKEILLKLARGQVNLEAKVQNIINLYKNKDNSSKEDLLNNFETDEFMNTSDKGFIDNKGENKSFINSKQSELTFTKKDNVDSEYHKKTDTKKEETDNDKDNKDEIEIEDNFIKENKSEIDNNNIKEIKENKGEIDNNNIKEKTEKKTEKEDKYEKEIKEKKREKDKKNEVEKVQKYHEKDNNKNERNEIENKQKEKEISFTESNENSNNAGINPNLIKNMARTIKQNKEKIAILEKEKIPHLEKEIIILRKQLEDSNTKSDVEFLNKQLNDMNSKMSKLEEKIENCEVKCSDFDILTMFKDDGSGSIDATKVMVKALEQKVFKKIEFVETKTKSSSYLNDKLELVINKIEKDRQNIEKLFNLTGNNKELIDEERNDINENTNNIKNIEENEAKFNKKLNDIKEKLTKKINELNEIINNNSKEIKELKNKGGENNLFKLGLNDNQIDKEIIDDINLKITDLRKKVNDLENSMKLHFENNLIDDLDERVKNMKLILDKKLTRDDLKELYNLHLSDLDEINDTNNRILSVNEQLKQTNTTIKGMLKKLDSLGTNLSLLQATQNLGAATSTSNQPIIDFSKYIDNQKLTETIKPIVKEMEKMYQEIYSLRRELTDVQNIHKDMVRQSNIDKLEEKIFEKINDVRNIFNKKYLDKAEHYKAVKNLETQIKVQAEENKRDADSWLMAKRPLKCFNCATCESNIKNLSPSNDYLAWNKYPPGDRIYRMGQGFSHMLQMMTSEFVKSIEKNTNEIQNESEHNIRNNKNTSLNSVDNGRMYTSSNINSEKTLLGLSVNNKQQIFDDSQVMQRKSGKLKLPIMTKYMKNRRVKNTSDIPISDDERENVYDKNNIEGSPKIVKIMKKKNFNTNYGFTETNDNNNTLNTEFHTKYKY